MTRRMCISLFLAACLVVFTLLFGVSMAQGIPSNRRPTADANKRNPQTLPGMVAAMMTPPPGLDDLWDNNHRSRPAKAPVNLSDPKACTRELAELASFGFFFNDMEDFRANAVGSAFGARLDAETLDRIFRFDHLAHSADPQFRDLVEQVRSIWSDAWRLNRAFYMAYSDYGTWISPLEKTMVAMKPYLTFLERIESDAAKRSTYYSSETKGGLGFDYNQGYERYSDGRGHYNVPHVDSAKYKQEFARLKMQCAPELQRLATAGVNRTRGGLEPVVAQEQEMWLIRLSLANLRRRMAGFWEKQLLPKLKQDAGPESKEPLAAFGMPALLAPKVKKINYGNLGAVLVRNASKDVLNHVTVQIAFKRSTGVVDTWYGYLPTLGRSQFFVSNYSGVVCRPIGQIGIQELGFPIELTVNVFCDEGRDVERKMVFAERKREERSGVPIAKAIKLFLDPDEDEIKKPGDPRIMPKDPETVLDEAEARYRLYRQGRRTIEPIPLEEKADPAAEEKLIKELRVKYPDPPHPDTVRQALASTVQIGRKYERPPLELVFDPFDIHSDRITGTITRKLAKGLTITDRVTGRFVDEIPRGCVIALINTRPLIVRQADADQKMAEKNPQPTREEAKVSAVESKYENAKRRYERAPNASAKATAEKDMRRLEAFVRSAQRKQQAVAEIKPQKDAMKQKMADQASVEYAKFVEGFLKPDSPVVTSLGDLTASYRRKYAINSASDRKPVFRGRAAEYVIYIDKNNEVRLETLIQPVQP